MSNAASLIDLSPMYFWIVVCVRKAVLASCFQIRNVVINFLTHSTRRQRDDGPPTPLLSEML